MALGSPGGRKIINCNTIVLQNVIDFGMSMQPAISAPRIDTSGRITYYDDRIGQGTADRLASLGHALEATTEEHNATGWDYAHPTAVLVGEDGLLRGGVDAVRLAESRGY